MHTLTGSNFIGFTTSSLGENSFQAFSTTANDFLPGSFHQATDAELKNALALAQKAFPIYSSLAFSQRADFLDAIAEEILNLGTTLLDRCVAESGLPMARVTWPGGGFWREQFPAGLLNGRGRYSIGTGCWLPRGCQSPFLASRHKRIGFISDC